jgi:hypothetical protein
VKRLLDFIKAFFRKRKLKSQIKRFLDGENPHVFLDVSGSMEYYVSQNKVDLKGILQMILKISPFMLWGLSHEIDHLKVVTSKERLNDLQIKWGGGTDSGLIKDLANPVIFITDECPNFPERTQNVRLLTLCISNELYAPSWAKSLAINIKGLFINGR